MELVLRRLATQMGARRPRVRTLTGMMCRARSLATVHQGRPQVQVTESLRCPRRRVTAQLVVIRAVSESTDLSRAEGAESEDGGDTFLVTYTTPESALCLSFCPSLSGESHTRRTQVLNSRARCHELCGSRQGTRLPLTIWTTAHLNPICPKEVTTD